jgi:L,D-transpeptidase catalytic domain
MNRRRNLHTLLIGASALVFGSAWVAPAHAASTAVPAMNAQPSAKAFTSSVATDAPSSPLSAATKAALNAFKSMVRPLSHPMALEDAFKSYFAFKSAHPNEVKKPLLYFVDYGLPSTKPRGYVFNMSTLQVVDGPFTVAHGRGSSTAQSGVPTRFSNGFGSSATSLGLYLAKAIYNFTGHMGGRTYSSIGMRLQGESRGFNDNALARGVVAHGAPYVTPTKAGRSQGCPAMEPARAQRLLPQIADGGMVYLFAPDANFMSSDQWINASAN